jgi:predicted glycoside hydrolase/deacetylase ChbG (UPF0249 family)
MTAQIISWPEDRGAIAAYLDRGDRDDHTASLVAKVHAELVAKFCAGLTDSAAWVPCFVYDSHQVKHETVHPMVHAIADAMDAATVIEAQRSMFIERTPESIDRLRDAMAEAYAEQYAAGLVELRY